MAIYSVLLFYTTNPLGVLTTTFGAFSTWTGASAPDGNATIFDNEAGVEGQTLDDATAGGETATADVWTGFGASDGASVDGGHVWTLRDTVTGETFQVVQFNVASGGATGSYTLSEIPLVSGRSYETLDYAAAPDVATGDPAFSYLDYDYDAFSAYTVTAPSGAGTVDGTSGDDDIRITNGYTDAQGEGLTNSGDTIIAGAGNDTVYAGSGDDIIYGGTGDDFLRGGNGLDQIFGGDGNDTIIADNSSSGAGEYLSGGAGDDTLTESFWSSTLDGGDGADFFNLGLGSATVIGGEGGTDYDMMSFDQANDTVNILFTGDEAGSYTDDDGDDGTFIEIEALELAAGNDVVDASADSTGIDILAGAGNDTLTGGSGDDTFTGGTGDDALTGGGGNDTFVYAAGDGADTISDFNTGNTGTLLDGDATNNDFIDLSAFYDHISELYADQIDDGVLNQSNTLDTRGNAVDYTNNASFGAGSLTFTGATGDDSFFTVENTGVVCFAKGTLIATPRGDVPVERLRVGDPVLTRDNGVQRLVWIGHRHLGWHKLLRNPDLKPVWLSPKLTGASRPLLVSPQHGVLLKQDGEEILFRAKHLAQTHGGGARVARGCTSVSYFHIAFDAHQIVFANGAPSESFYPGPQALAALPRAARKEFAALFPGLASANDRAATRSVFGDPARAYSRRRHLPEALRCLATAG